MSPIPLRVTAVAVLFVLASANIPTRAGSPPEKAPTPIVVAAPDVAARVADFEKARREAAVPLAPAATTEPAPAPPKSHKKAWIIVGVVLGVVAVAAVAGGGGSGGGGGGY